MSVTLQMDSSVVNQLSQRQQEPDWMLQNRLAALLQVDQLSLPKVEKTSIDRWNFTQFQLDNEATNINNLDELPTEISEFISTDAPVIVQKNGSILYRQPASEQGVIFTDLASATREHSELIQKYFMQAMKPDEHQLAALHAALTSGGIFLYVPRNAELTVPLQGLFWLAGEKTAMFPHILIVAEANSRVDFVANYIALGTDHPALNNSVIEVFVGANASVRISTVNHLSESTVDVTYRRSVVDRDGRLEWIVGDFSDGRVISDNTIQLAGMGGDVNVRSVALGAGEMRANITTNISHAAGRTTSDINARSVMKDSASSILNSITKIEKGASKSDGQQTGKVLMLNPQARGDANPILLIDENDVTAGHAASVGRIDPTQMYYLMSRGITRAEAEKLVIYGFLDAVISDIPSESLRASLHRVIERKFQV